MDVGLSLLVAGIASVASVVVSALTIFLHARDKVTKIKVGGAELVFRESDRADAKEAVEMLRQKLAEDSATDDLTATSSR